MSLKQRLERLETIEEDRSILEMAKEIAKEGNSPRIGDVVSGAAAGTSAN